MRQVIYPVAAGLIAMIALGIDARAGTIEYSYQGNGFNAFVDGSGSQELSSANSVTFNFVTDTALAANSTYHIVDGGGNEPASLLSWQISDGLHIVSSAGGDSSGDLGQSIVSTDGSGQITGWNIVVDAAATESNPEVTITSCGASPCLQSIGVSGSYAGEYVQITPSGGSFLYAAVSSSPGIWTSSSSAVPEPSPLIAWATGLIGLGLIFWRRVAGSAAPRTA